MLPELSAPTANLAKTAVLAGEMLTCEQHQALQVGLDLQDLGLDLQEVSRVTDRSCPLLPSSPASVASDR